MVRTGIVLALLSAVLFGASTPFAKLLLGNGINPWLLAGLLYLSSGIGLSLVHFGRHFLGIAATEAPLRRADLPWLALVVLSGGVIGPLLLMIGLATTAASTAAARTCSTGRSSPAATPSPCFPTIRAATRCS